MSYPAETPNPIADAMSPSTTGEAITTELKGESSVDGTNSAYPVEWGITTTSTVADSVSSISGTETVEHQEDLGSIPPRNNGTSLAKSQALTRQLFVGNVSTIVPAYSRNEEK